MCMCAHMHAHYTLCVFVCIPNVADNFLPVFCLDPQGEHPVLDKPHQCSFRIIEKAPVEVDLGLVIESSAPEHQKDYSV